MRRLAEMEERYERFRIKNFSSAEFILGFYLGACMLIILLCVPYRFMV